MTSELERAIAGAEAYERLHVPALFRAWVDPVLDAAAVQAGNRVVDVACGTGILARGARSRVGPEGSVTGVDPGVGMLAVAQRLEPRIQWLSGVAEALPVEDASVDRVVSQFGMMFFTDRGRAVDEMARVTRPGGRIAVAVWDALERQPAWALEVDLLERRAGAPAADALRAPFVLGNPEALAALFDRAGLTDVRVETRDGEARYPSVRTLVEADLRGWLPLVGVDLDEPLIEWILDEAEDVLADFVGPDGGVVFPAPAHVATAVCR